MGIGILEMNLEQLLLTPIRVQRWGDRKFRPTGKSPRISMDNGTWISTQNDDSGSHMFDADMCDLAVEFYKVFQFPNGEPVYSLDLRFLGDTMNSLNTTRWTYYRSTAVDKSYQEFRHNPKIWPPELQELQSRYHCLANFWVLPMRIARGGCHLGGACGINRGCNNNEKDYVDKHLVKVVNFFLDDKDSFDCQSCGNHSDFYARFGAGEEGLSNFKSILCLEPYFESDGTPVKLKNLEPLEFCRKALELMERRAESLTGTYGERLLNLFESFQLELG